jgi:hypothetical protein
MNANLRAAQIWPVLAWAATNRQTLTYGMLGKLIGVPARGLGHLIDPIHAYCVENGMPPLTALVVSSDAGMPGTGFRAAGDVPKALQEVFSFDWLDVGGAPLPEAFKARVRHDEEARVHWLPVSESG